MTRPVEDYGDIGELMDEYLQLSWDPTAIKEGSEQVDFNRHVLIEWNGGMLWLELQDLTRAAGAGTDFSPHFGIDVRWVRDGLVVDQGVFVLNKGQKYGLKSAMGGIDPPQGSHGWPGGETISILVDAPPLGEAEFAEGSEDGSTDGP